MAKSADPSKFQSTLPRGERPSTSIPQSFYFGISIHAPARGATVPMILLFLIILFQSTLPRGERRAIIFFFVIAHTFQSTLPRGERLVLLYLKVFISVFQSTLPRGERRLGIYSRRHLRPISIHAPARGATPKLTNFYPK